MATTPLSRIAKYIRGNYGFINMARSYEKTHDNKV